VPAGSDRFRGERKSRHESELSRWGTHFTAKPQAAVAIGRPRRTAHIPLAHVGHIDTGRLPSAVSTTSAIHPPTHPPTQPPLTTSRWGPFRRFALMGMAWQAPMGAARTSSSRPTAAPSAGSVLASEAPATRPSRPPHSRTRSSHGSDEGSWDPVNARLGCLRCIAVTASSSLLRTSDVRGRRWEAGGRTSWRLTTTVGFEGHGPVTPKAVMHADHVVICR
jgi:hypothetical protein